MVTRPGFIRAVQVTSSRKFEDKARTQAGLDAAARAAIELGETVTSVYGLQGQGWHTLGQYYDRGSEALWCADGRVLLELRYFNVYGQSCLLQTSLDAHGLSMIVIPADMWYAVIFPPGQESRLEAFRPKHLAKRMRPVTDRLPPGYDISRVYVVDPD